MITLDFIRDKYGLDYSVKQPVRIPISREDGLIELFKELGYLIGAEVGVRFGNYSERFADGISGLKLFCIDPWIRYDGYSENRRQNEFDRQYEAVKQRMAGKATLVRKFSLDAADIFKDGYFDFVYIDANHEFLHITQDIAAWLPKVKKGGIISGHDFLRSRPGQRWQCHVKDVVQAWTFSHGINPWFITDKDEVKSWFWVVQ